MNMYDFCYEESLKRAVHKVWILSDLQQGDPANTEKCLAIGTDDFERLGCPAEQIWYLGDSVEGDDAERLKKMCAMQEESFGRLKLPLCYATGNHDYDYVRSHPERSAKTWFRETVKDHPGWLTTESDEDFYFRTMLGEYPVYFLCDHVSEKNEWLVTHSRIVRGKAVYPYTQADADRLHEKLVSETHPYITASHYCFAGGNRDHALLDTLFPLPENHMIHFYGHSHIGDFCGAENIYRRISWIDWHDIPQIDVSSFENIRGEFCRSALAHIYEDGSMGIFFRNHDAHCFTEAYFPAVRHFPDKMSLKPVCERIFAQWAEMEKQEK